MKKIQGIWNDFLAGKGLQVAGAQALQKALNFFRSLIVIHLISPESYGWYVYAISVLSFLMPIMGGGMHQSLVRFSPNQSNKEQENTFHYAQFWGLIFSLGMALVLVALGPWLSKSLPQSQWILSILAFQLVGAFMNESLAWYARVKNDNERYAKILSSQAIVLFCSSTLASWIFGVKGLALAVTFSPLFNALFWWFKYGPKVPMSRPRLEQSRDFQWYGWTTSLGGVASQLLFVVDIIIIGNLIALPEALSGYKAMSMIPFALLFIPNAFLTTQFVGLVHHSSDAQYLKNYLRGFIPMFLALGAFLVVIFYFFSESISLLFGASYSHYHELLPVFGLGMLGAMAFRIPLGNLLSAVGWAKVNSIISSVVLLLNIVFNIYAVKTYGIWGAAWVTAILFWVSGLGSLLAIYLYLKKLKTEG